MKRTFLILSLLAAHKSEAADWTRIALYGGAIADHLSTQVVLSRGGIETNPIVPSRSLPRLALKLGGAAGIDLLAKWTKQPNIRMIGAVAWTSAASWNVSIYIKRMRRQR